MHEKEIADKGKASLVAKVLVCAQAIWMVLQCISRKASGLPVTMIELNVVMHVVCAVVMCGFWWNKPLDAGEPIVLTEIDEEASAALILAGWYDCGDVYFLDNAPTLSLSDYDLNPKPPPYLANLAGFDHYLLHSNVGGQSPNQILFDTTEGIAFELNIVFPGSSMMSMLLPAARWLRSSKLSQKKRIGELIYVEEIKSYGGCRRIFPRI